MSFIRRFWAQRMGAIIAEADVSQYVETLQFELYPPVPAVGTGAALAAATQPGSQIWFVDPVDGVDPPQAVCYLHDGAKLIDTAGNANNPVTGLPYGTDWLNPGAGIVAVKHWAAVAPTRTGHAAGARTNAVGYPHCPGGTAFDAAGRNTYPDHWYIKRGTTLDLSADLASYMAVNPAWVSTAQNISVPGSSIARGGPQVVGSYGSLSLSPPKILDPKNWGFANRVGGTFDAVYQSLHFDQHTRGIEFAPVAAGGSAAGGSTFSISSAFSLASKLRIQDVLFDGCQQIGATPADSLLDIEVVDCFAVDSHSSRVGINSTFDAHGADSTLFAIHNTIVTTGGYSNNPRHVRDNWGTFPEYVPGQACAWGDYVKVTTGVDVFAYYCHVAGATSTLADNYRRCGVNRLNVHDDVRNRNCYFASPGEFIQSASLCGGSGFQFRNGGKIDGSFFYEGYVTCGMARPAGGGYPDGQVTNYIRNVTIQNYSPHSLVSAHPGWGLAIGGGANDTLVTGLLVTGAQFPAANGLRFEPVGLETSGYLYSRPTRRTRVTASVLDCANGPAVSAMDGAAVLPWDYRVAYSAGTHDPNAAYSVGATRRSAPYPAQGASYICIQRVFANQNIPLTNAAYWAPTVWEPAGQVRVDAWPTEAAYVCIQDAPANTPVTNTAYWMPASPTETALAGYGAAQAPGLIDNTLDATCKIISAKTRAEQVSYLRQWGAPATAGVTIDPASQLYANRAAYAAATPGAVDTERTLRTYLQAVMGWTITSPDGVKELCDYITGRTTGQPQHRGNRDARLSAAAIGGYVRGGWGL